jgi:hypothetical protein
MFGNVMLESFMLLGYDFGQTRIICTLLEACYDLGNMVLEFCSIHSVYFAFWWSLQLCWSSCNMVRDKLELTYMSTV